MNIIIDQHELQQVVAAAVERAVGAYMRSAGRTKQKAPAKEQVDILARVVTHVEQARRFTKDKRFGAVLKLGLMPHSKLVQFFKEAGRHVTSEELLPIINQAIDQGRIKVAVRGVDFPENIYRGVVYATGVSSGSAV